MQYKNKMKKWLLNVVYVILRYHQKLKEIKMRKKHNVLLYYYNIIIIFIKILCFKVLLIRKILVALELTIRNFWWKLELVNIGSMWLLIGKILRHKMHSAKMSML